MKKFLILIFSLGVITILLNFIPVQVYHDKIIHVSIFNYNGENKINYTKLFFYITFLLLSCISLFYILQISKPYISIKNKLVRKSTSDKESTKENDDSPSSAKLDTPLNESSKKALKTFNLSKGFSNTLLLIAIILSSIWIFVELVHYYKKYDRLILESKILYNEEYKFNYWFILYLAVSILLRCKGLYNYIVHKTSPFSDYYYGQLMAIAITLGYYTSSKFWMMLLIPEILFLLAFAAYDRDFLQHIKNKKQKIILFIFVTISILGCCLNILDATNKAQDIGSIQLLIAAILLIATSISFYGLIQIYNNDYTGFKSYYIGQGVEIALFLVLFIMASQRFSNMLEEQTSSITNYYVLKISPVIVMTIAFYLYKRSYPLNSNS